MFLTLYRKYRPQNFAEIIGQKYIVQTLSNAVKFNRIGQAYLFAGPRGTGKTTLARIFAKAINCEKISGISSETIFDRHSDNKSQNIKQKSDLSLAETRKVEPCQKCRNCLNITEGKSFDIIEIDAASHTGVDNIRELRETIKLPPTGGRYKVYIIDEAHMLSIGAFNALLKTLEEPPAHVVFILATTEIHKLPETILSRCQRFDFARLSLEQIVKKMANIAKLEGVKIENEALQMIAIAAEGGMRNAESLLAQIIALEDKNITAKEVEDILGAARSESVEKMIDYILSRETQKALKLVAELSDEGINFEVFHKSLLNHLRRLMVVSVNSKLADLFSLEMTKEKLKILEEKAENHRPMEILSALETLIESRRNTSASFIPSLPLEIAIVKTIRHFETQKLESKAAVSSITSPLLEENKDNDQKKQESLKSKAKLSHTISKSDTQISIAKNKTQNGKILTIEEIEDSWSEIIDATKPYNHSVMAFLSNCQPIKIENNRVFVVTKYNLYKDKLNEYKNRSVIESAASKILGSEIFFIFQTEEEAGVKMSPQSTTKNQKQAKSENGSLLDDAIKIMGGKIVE